MSSLRGAVHVVVAVAYIGLLAGALRLQWAARAAVRDSGGVAQLRLAGLVVIGLGLLIAAFTLWAGRHVVGAAVATALLTVVLAVQPPFRVSPAPQWVNDVLWNIGLLGDHTVVLAGLGRGGGRARRRGGGPLAPRAALGLTRRVKPPRAGNSPAAHRRSLTTRGRLLRVDGGDPWSQKPGWIASSASCCRRCGSCCPASRCCSRSC